MFTPLYIFSGLLFFFCLAAGLRYLWKENPYKKCLDQLNYLNALKLAKHVRIAKDNRSPDFVHQSEVLPFQT